MESKHEEEVVGRGMIGVSMDEEAMIQMEHQETDKTFEFLRDDLDEVIAVLTEFREFLEQEERVRRT